MYYDIYRESIFPPEIYFEKDTIILENDIEK